MATGTELMGATLLVVEGTAALAVAGRIARRVTGPDLLDRLLVGTLVALAQVVGIPLLLGCLDALGRWPILVAHLAVLAGVWALVRELDERNAPTPRPRDYLTTATTAGVTGLWLYLSLRAGVVGDADSREYHVANLASWFQRHNIWHLPFANPGFITATHPGNGEMAALWLIAATGRDQLAYAAPLPFGILAIVAVAFLAREIGGSSRSGTLAAIAAVACPLFFINEVRTLQTDLPAAAGLVVATGLLLRFTRDRCTSWLVLGGIALGLGVGSKYTVALPAALLAVIAVVIVDRRRRLVATIPGLLLFAGPWLLRNAVTTGNPLFPEEVLSIFPAGSTPIDVFSTRMITHLADAHTVVLRAWWRLARRFIGPAGLLPVVGIAMAWRPKGRTKDRTNDRTTSRTRIVAAMAIGSTISYLLTPYTGAGAHGYLPLLGSNERYLLPAILFGCALFAATVPERIAVPAAFAVLGYDLWWEVQRQTLRSDIRPRAGLVVGALLIGMVVAVVGLIRVRPAPLAVVAGILLFAAIHHADRVGPNAIEVTLDRVAGRHGPVEVLGVNDLRSVLGEDLRRPLVLVSAGGRAHERPFSDRAEVIARFESGPPVTAPRDETVRLDAALLAAGRSVLIVGPATGISSPVGWAPDRRSWCLVHQFPAVGIYARCSSYSRPSGSTPAAALIPGRRDLRPAQL